MEFDVHPSSPSPSSLFIRVFMEIEDFEKYNLGIALRKSENSEIEDFGLGRPSPHPPPIQPYLKLFLKNQP